MRNLKKFLALVLAMIMVVSAAAVVSADFTDVPAENRYAEAINDLAVKGIVKGTSDTTFGPDQNVTRWQMALFVARAMSGIVESDADWANGHVQYVDVTEYKGAIEYVNTRGVINGWADPITGEPVFGPNDGITYVQALKMAVCALGYTEALDWPYGYYNKAATLGLTNNLVVDSIDTVLTRAEVAQIIYNMIYAAPANGGLTLAETNFSVKTPDNTTLFVVVATPKQYYAKVNDDAADKGDRPNFNATADVAGTWVGIQPLVNGVANGQITYLPCEQLGIAAGEVEDYFNRTVELINYDKATGEFTDVELGKAPVIVNHTDIAISGAKVKHKGVTYTPSTTISGATLINEIVIYSDASVDTVAKVLPVDADGNIIDGKGRVVATVLYTNANGTKWYFDENNGFAMTEEDALDEYGVFVKDEAAEFVRYNTVAASDLSNKAYQLEMYDDNGDGDYERAVVRNIYMGVYYTELANFDGAEREADGMLLDLGHTLTANSVEYIYADGVAKKAQKTGSIVVYTYNPQRNRVTVLDILEMKQGELTKVNAKGFAYTGDPSDTDTANNVQVTFDGKTTLKLGYNIISQTGPKWSINGAQLGADLQKSRNTKGKNDTVLDLGEEAFLEYYYTSKADLAKFVDTYEIGKTYAYYAYNGYILMMDEVVEEEVCNIAVMEEFVDFDFGEVYLNMYVGTEYEEEALVTVIDGKELSKLSNYKFSMLISKQELFYPGLIYEVDKNEDAYELGDQIPYDANDDTLEEYGLFNAKVADDDYDADDSAKQVGTIEFKNGSTTGADRTKRLRTNSDTVFYFIEKEVVEVNETPDPMETTVTAYVGSGEDFTINFNENSTIWTDSLGTVNDRATVVYVINAKHDFFNNNLGSRWVIMEQVSQYKTSTVSVEEALGDAADDYNFKTDYLYEYTGNFYDMDNGDKLSTIYTTVKMSKPRSHSFIKVDENGVADYTGTSSLVSWKAGSNNPNHPNNDFHYYYMSRAYEEVYGITDINSDASTVVENGWGTPNGRINYFDWLYYHKMDIDVDNKEKVPSSIMEVKLTEDVFYAEYVDGYVVIYDVAAKDYICDEDDGITDITVIDIKTNKTYTGKDAIDYLVRSTWINYVVDPEYLKDGEIVFMVANTFGDTN